jgi:hypothetical protein
MARALMRSLFILLVLTQLGASCQGTETGNPGAPKVYMNEEFGVEAQFNPGWNFVEDEVPASDGVPTEGDPAAAPGEGIDTSGAPFTEFTDGITTVTLFFVTLAEEPASLEDYLTSVFPSRTFEVFSNGQISGFRYDNPEPGETGGDRQEYYFLQGTTLLFVVTDLFETNNGIKKFETIIESLHFE